MKPKRKNTISPINEFHIPYSNYVEYSQTNEQHINIALEVTFGTASSISVQPHIRNSHTCILFQMKFSFSRAAIQNSANNTQTDPSKKYDAKFCEAPALPFVSGEL